MFALRTATASKDSISLLDWRILKSNRGHHLVGTDVVTGRCHASPALRDLDLAEMRGFADVGRTYHLIGLPSSTDDWVKMWTAWCVLFCEPSPIDVTAEVLRWRSTVKYVRHVATCDGSRQCHCR